jgi:hypothetical protein
MCYISKTRQTSSKESPTFRITIRLLQWHDTHSLEELMKIKKQLNYETQNVPEWDSTFLDQGCTNPGRSCRAFFTVTSNMCGHSVRNMFRVTIRAPRILRKLLVFGKFMHPCDNCFVSRIYPYDH